MLLMEIRGLIVSYFGSTYAENVANQVSTVATCTKPGVIYPQPLGICCLHTPELGTQLVERCFAEAALAAPHFGGYPGLRLLEDANDLLFFISIILLIDGLH